jgi:hypothetical protein
MSSVCGTSQRSALVPTSYPTPPPVSTMATATPLLPHPDADNRLKGIWTHLLASIPVFPPVVNHPRCDHACSAAACSATLLSVGVLGETVLHSTLITAAALSTSFCCAITAGCCWYAATQGDPVEPLDYYGGDPIG